MQTTNIVDENIKRIGELFPNWLTERLNDEGKPEVAIDFDQLRPELSKNLVEEPEERYQFTWPEKRNAIRLANAPTTDTLRPCHKESVDFAVLLPKCLFCWGGKWLAKRDFRPTTQKK